MTQIFHVELGKRLQVIYLSLGGMHSSRTCSFVQALYWFQKEAVSEEIDVALVSYRIDIVLVSDRTDVALVSNQHCIGFRWSFS